MLLVGAVCCALVGALSAPAYVVLAVTPAFGLFVAGLVGLMDPAFPKAPSAKRRAVLAGAGASLVVPCLAGLAQLGDAGTVAGLVLLFLSCLLAEAWITRSLGSAGRDDEAEVDVEELQRLLRALPTSVLMRDWRSTGELVRTAADPDRRARGLLVRTVLLEEMTRRDPAGVARWLRTGDDDAPEQYLSGDRDTAP
ncbi:hypothetical protein [Geodermatophilus sp. SYSU D00698]